MSSLRRRLWFAGLASMAMGACSAFSANDEPAAPAPDADASADGETSDRQPVQGGAHIILDYADAPAQIFTGTSADVTVKVQRDGEGRFSGLVHVELAPIDGITAIPLDIQADHQSGVFTISIDQRRQHGLIPLSIVGTSPGTLSTGSVIYTPLIRGPAGSVDTGFGTNGVFSLAEASSGSGLLVMNDQIFVGGSVGDDLTVVSLRADGTPDPAFGTKGIARRSVGSLVSTNDLDTLKSGALYLGATTSGGAVVAAFTATGSAPAFGTNGVQAMPFVVGSTLGHDAFFTTLIVGGRPVAGSADSAAVSYDESGVPAEIWPSGRALQYSNSCSGVSDDSGCLPRGLSTSGVMTPNLFLCAWQHSGSALVGTHYDGTAFPTVETSPYLDRCTSTFVKNGLVYMAGDAAGLATMVRVDGSSIDMNFNPGGARPAAATAPAGSGLTLAKKIIGQEDGSFVIASDAKVNGEGAFGVWRLTSTGRTDLGFGNATGFATSAIAGTNVTVSSMGVDSEGRVIVAGSNGHMVVTRIWQ